MTGEQTEAGSRLCKFKRTISTTEIGQDEAGNLTGDYHSSLPVGTVGGSIAIHPGAQFAMSYWSSKCC